MNIASSIVTNIIINLRPKLAYDAFGKPTPGIVTALLISNLDDFGELIK